MMPAFRASELNDETWAKLTNCAVDITGAKAVDVVTNAEKTVVHVNVNGVCVLRVCRIENLTNK